jgi:hypothetical protein
MKGPPRKPAKFADALSSFLAHSKLGERVEQARIVPEWPALVGAQIAAVTEPIMITRDGTLFVAVKTSSWMEPQLRAAINVGRESKPVLKIHWRLMG